MNSSSSLNPSLEDIPESCLPWFSDLVNLPETYAICLYEFDSGNEIRRLTNCRHVFHMSCLDRWMDLIDLPETYVVCLYEFDSGNEIQQLTNCRHMFHKSCLNRWMDHDWNTCPLCRSPFIADDLQDSLNERLWAASGIGELYGEYSQITGL